MRLKDILVSRKNGFPDVLFAGQSPNLPGYPTISPFQTCFLRDSIRIALSIPAEASTAEIPKKRNPKGFTQKALWPRLPITCCHRKNRKAERRAIGIKILRTAQDDNVVPGTTMRCPE